MRLTSPIVFLVPLALACSPETPRTPNPASSSSARTVVAGWESVAVRRDSSVATVPVTTPAEDSLYTATLAENLLPDERKEPPIALAPTDEIDMTNYQSSGWWLGWSDDPPQPRARRFLADYSRFTSGVLVLALDTTLVRNQTQAPFDTKLADSIAVRGLAKTERFSTNCKFGAHSFDERLNGVVPDTTANTWMRPRLAWMFDTVSARIRRIKPDSMKCMLMPDPD